MFLSLCVVWWNMVLGDVDGGSGGQRRRGVLRVRVDPRITRNICTGLTVVTRSPSRMIVSFTYVLPKVPGTGIGSHIIVTPRRTGHLLCTLRSGLDGCRRGFKRVSVRGKKKPQVISPFGVGGKRTWNLLFFYQSSGRRPFTCGEYWGVLLPGNVRRIGW